MTHIKQNTDIGDFKVKKIPAVEKNASLQETTTYRSHFISKRIRQKAKRRRASEVRVNRLISELEE